VDVRLRHPVRPISVDFDTLERTPKLSADWFRAAARRNAVVKMILLFILVWGMFAGWIAHLLLARGQPVNWAELLIIGLAGSFVGGLLISLASGDGLALRPSGIIGSILGAVILLAAWQAVRGGARGRSR
jgi:uncharacterized membrane protein YeaQ/YmgE (transglycosylase-associated protein family)